MKKLFATLCAGLALLASQGAAATLIGDTVTVEHHFTFGTPAPFYGSEFPVVVAGPADMVLMDSSFTLYTVDVDAFDIFVDFTFESTWLDGGEFSFNGLVVSDLDFLGGDPLIGFLIETNMAGWDDSRVMFGPDFIGLGWHGLSFDEDTFFHVRLLIGPRGPIPTPAPLTLMALALAGWGIRRRLS